MKYIKHLLFGIAFLLCLGIAGVKKWQLTQRQEKDQQIGIDKAKSELSRATKLFDARLRRMMKMTEDFAIRMETANLDSAQAMNELLDILEKEHDLFGLGLAYKPYEFSSNRRLYAPFYIRPNDSIQIRWVEDHYDYLDVDWYTRPMKNGAEWFEPPYLGTITQTMMAEYTVPFHKTDSSGNKERIGIVYLDYSIEEISKAVKAFDLGKSGYGLVASKEGLLMSHPISDYMQEGKTIEDISKLWGDSSFKESFDNVSSEPVKLTNQENGKEYRLFVETIDATGWKMGAVFVEDAFKTDYSYQARVNIEITLLIACAALIVFLYLLSLTSSPKVKYIYVALYSGSIAFCLIYIWYFKLENHNNIFDKENSFPITEQSTLQKFINDRDSLRIHNFEKEYLKISTGVFVKHVQFDGSHNIQLSGVVWQKYPIGKDGKELIKPDLFFLAAAPDAEAQDFRKIYVKKENNHVLHGWHFRLEIREELDYAHYPFDKETVSLRIAHPDVSQNVLIVPDLKSYTSINPTQLLGLDPEIVLPDWVTEGTYYDYSFVNFNTNFGMESNMPKLQHPEMNYNIVLKRKFFWPFMSNFVPLLAILILLFLAVLTFTRNRGQISVFGFSGFGMLELATALLFVAILTHIDLRSSVTVNYLIYLDYFYFHVYLAILFYSCNAMYFIRKQKIDEKFENRLAKMIFWPALLTSLFIFTCVNFY